MRKKLFRNQPAQENVVYDSVTHNVYAHNVCE